MNEGRHADERRFLLNTSGIGDHEVRSAQQLSEFLMRQLGLDDEDAISEAFDGIGHRSFGVRVDE